MIGSAAAADSHREAVSQEADRHTGACPASTNPRNTGQHPPLS